MKRHILVAVSFVAVVGCAGPSQPAAEPVSPAQPTLHRISDPGPRGVRSVILEPVRIPGIFGPGPIQGLQVSVGAVYASRGQGDDSHHSLGLVFEAASDTARLLFRGDRRLLLDIDGRIFVSPPSSPQLYTIRDREPGVTEVIMVPVTPELLRRFVDGEAVRGRLGQWATIEFTKEQRARFEDLLEEIPADARFGSKERTAVRPPALVTGQP